MTLFSIERTLALLFMPIGIIWLALLFLALICLNHRQRGLASLFLGIALLYACAGNVYLARALMGRLEQDVSPVNIATLQPLDVIFIIRGTGEMDFAGSPELGPPDDCVFLAARLWHAGKARLLVTDGNSRENHASFRNSAQETATLLRGVGIPDQAIFPLEVPCWNSRDEIKAYAQLQARFKWERMGLVASASYLPRALALGAKEGLNFIPLGADWVGRQYPLQIYYLVPQGEGFRDTQRACWEYLNRWFGL